uniref:Acid phosphatase n=1 Tax=Acrobeloides nanus TaxID=290746 RepID=A0A914BZ42_9BILA
MFFLTSWLEDPNSKKWVQFVYEIEISIYAIVLSVIAIMSVETWKTVFIKTFKNFFKFINGDELIFLQSVWRHGDRNPLESFPNDPYRFESNWTEGWGELTVRGMEQHFNLGQNLSKKYSNFIGQGPYNSRQIYIRSTDVNRTVISAMSNLIGFYYGQGNVSVNFPNITQWPTGFVPIAVHTFEYENDHVGNPHAKCKRLDELLSLVEKTPEYQNLTNDSAFKEKLATVQNLTGWSTLDFDSMWYLADTLYIEHFVYKFSNVDPNLVDMFDFINSTTDTYYDWVNGWELKPYQGVNFSVEIPTAKGGTLLWSIIGLMNEKISCKNNPNDTSDKCNWINKLKYYAYSAHDSTLAALFSTLGFKRPNYNEDGYPHYSSCITFELWLDNNSRPYVKALYWPLNEPIEDVTSSITGCTTNCSLDTFNNRSVPYRPGNDGNILDWCNMPLFGNESSTPQPKSGMSFRTNSILQYFLLIVLLIIRF